MSKAPRAGAPVSRSALPSIAGRLSRVLLHAALAWGLAVSAVVGLAVHHEVNEVMDGALQESAEILYGMLSLNAGQLPLARQGMLPAPPHGERLVWQLVDARQQVTLRSHRAPDAPLVAGGGTGLVGLADGVAGHRVYGLPFGDQGLRLYVAQPAADRQAAQLEAMTITVLAALGVGALCALWLGRGVARELTPLQALSAQVATFQPMESGAHLPDAARAELAPLRAAVAGLAERLAQRVASERSVAAHAAHALRTPLAGLSAQLAVAQREGGDAMRPRLERARAAADRLSRVVTSLLTLFRAGVDPERRPVDLQVLVAQLPVDGLQVHVAGPCQANVDPDLLSAALANLLDNAVRHGATELWVDLAVDATSTRLRLRDNGPGVDAARRAQIERALAGQADGSGGGGGGGVAAGPGGERAMGLGLALADRVARAHGGRLQLLHPDSGFAVELLLAPA